MKKIRIFIVTYKNDEALRKNLDAMYASDMAKHDYSICVINNHSTIGDFSGYKNLRILNNDLRPDWSCGHLARNWNQALIIGFENLKNPACDYVVACQNDTVLHKDWVAKIIELHKKYSFIQRGNGDNFMSWTPEGVKRIGLWDERFCNIGFQEGDYFMRARIYNNAKSTIYDPGHKRILNATGDDIVVREFSQAHGNKEAHHVSKKYHAQSGNIFKMKWGIRSIHWKDEPLPKSPGIPSFIFYPYFEWDIETLDEQRYIYNKSDKYQEY